MTGTIAIVRCPRCGSTDAESVEPLLAEFDRMRCHACGHEEICDEHQIRRDWNERVPAPPPADAAPAHEPLPPAPPRKR